MGRKESNQTKLEEHLGHIDEVIQERLRILTFILKLDMTYASLAGLTMSLALTTSICES